MEVKEIQKLAIQGEGQKVEFKRSMAELETIVRAITAFANADGGVVLLGVRDSGEVIGVEIGDQTKERLSAAITDATDPIIYPVIEMITVEGKTVIAIKVEASENRPHLYKGRAYKRVGATDTQLSRDAYEKLLLLRATAVYDRQPLIGAHLTDLSEKRIHWYLKQRAEKRGTSIPGISLPDLLIGLGAAVEQADEVLPTRAGMLCFGKKPQDFIPHSQVRIARFKGVSTSHFIDRADLNGTLPEMIDAAEQFIRRNTRLAAKIVGFRRREVTEYPFEAIREAICNAVCHRDYRIEGATVRAMVFDDRIEINSPGGLPQGVTLAEIERKHVLRNPVIAGCLYDIFYIEKWGTGIARMRRSMREHGLAAPHLEDLDDFFAVTFYGPGDRILDLIPEEGTTDLRGLGLNKRQIEALRIMTNEGKEFTNSDYRRQFEVSRNTASRDLQGLVNTGWVRAGGNGKSTRYFAA
ncbi:MAG: RNA-binding domain-containing protein [bacterium]